MPALVLKATEQSSVVQLEARAGQSLLHCVLPSRVKRRGHSPVQLLSAVTRLMSGEFVLGTEALVALAAGERPLGFKEMMHIRGT